MMWTAQDGIQILRSEIDLNDDRFNLFVCQVKFFAMKVSTKDT